MDSLEKSVFNELFVMGEGIDACDDKVQELSLQVEDAVGSIVTLTEKLGRFLSTVEGGAKVRGGGGEGAGGGVSPVGT